MKTFFTVLLATLGFCGYAEKKDGTNKMDLEKIKHGVIFFTFDDRNFDGWKAAIPLWEKYNAKATFFVSGKIDNEAIETMKILQQNGHSIGLHTTTHANANDAFDSNSGDEYMQTAVFPQLEACRKAGLFPKNFAYPNNRRTLESDQAMLKYFRKLRAGITGGTKGKDLLKVEKLYRPVSALKKDYLLGGAGIGEYYDSDPAELLAVIKKAAAENLAVVFFSHNIAPGAKHIHMPQETLELCLREAAALGVKVAGFDDIP